MGLTQPAAGVTTICQDKRTENREQEEQ